MKKFALFAALCAVTTARLKLQTLNPLKAKQRKNPLAGIKLTKQHAAIAVGVVQAILQARRKSNAPDEPSERSSNAFEVSPASVGSAGFDDCQGQEEAVSALRDV